MLSGMEPDNLLLERSLHPNKHSRVGLGVELNVFHIKYALRFEKLSPHHQFGQVAETLTPLKQRYPHTNDGCQNPGNVTSKSTHAEVSAHEIPSIPLRYALSVVYRHSRKMEFVVVRKKFTMDGSTLLGNITSWILTLKYDSQIFKGCQVSNVVWNGARQSVA